MNISKISLFEYIIPSNERLYRGSTNNINDKNYKIPSWYATDIDIARHYGDYIHMYRTLRPLKFINIMSEYFHIFLIDLVNDMFKNDSIDIAYDKKMELLVPLGLPNSKEQFNYIYKKTGITPELNHRIEKNVAFYNNKHRFSHEIFDKKIVELLKQIAIQYNFDGYIAPAKWPSYFNKMFHPEICIFELDEDKIFYEQFQLLQGGSSSNDEPTKFINPEENYYKNMPTQEEQNRRNIEWLRLFKYKGPIKYDVCGNVVMLTFTEIADYNLKHSLIESASNENNKPEYRNWAINMLKEKFNYDFGSKYVLVKKQ